VPEDESVCRLLRRGATSGRSDDNDAVIRNRLREYNEKTLPVLQFFKDRGLYREVDGTLPIDVVGERIDAFLTDELRKRLFNVVLFGYPGSGRGSQGRALAKTHGLEYVATGTMLDEEIRRGTEIGKRMTALYDSGELVPDEIVVQLIEQRLAASKGAKGFIFKGYPRTHVQSYILDALLKKHESSISRIIELEVPMLELIARLDARSKTPRSMPYDSSTAKIVRRLQDHETKTLPVIAKYSQRHEVVRIDGTGTFDDVYSRLSAVVEDGLRRLR